MAVIDFGGRADDETRSAGGGLAVVMSDERRACASLVSLGSRLGFGLCVVLFALYLLPTHFAARIPPREVPAHWDKPVAEYVALTGAPTGWEWVKLLRWSDSLNVVGIAVLASITFVCYSALLVVFLRKRNMAYVAISLAQISILALAASGVLNRFMAGGH